MNRRARLLIGCAMLFCAARGAHAQVALQSTPPPSVTAEAVQWYQNGEPVMFAGSFYYRAGPQIHFNGNEMVRSGFFQGVPVYSRTTIEPFSIVYVPLPGGLMQPYERRRTGEIAGTSGSSAPSFPVASPAEMALGTGGAVPLPQAAGPPTLLGSPIPFEEAVARPSSALALPSVAPVAVPNDVRMAPMPAPQQPVRVAGSVRAAAPVRRPATRVPLAANGVFIEFDNARWFSSGPARLFDAKTFTRIGELRGFPVYTTRGSGATIFIPVAEGLDLVAPYTRRDKRERRPSQP
jgi:hypothetical protein